MSTALAAITTAALLAAAAWRFGVLKDAARQTAWSLLAYGILRYLITC